LSVFAYVLGMGTLERFIEDRLIQGQATFSREEAEAALDLTKDALTEPHRVSRRPVGLSQTLLV